VFDSTALPLRTYRRAPETMPPPEITRRKHPHFDDRGTLDWTTSYAEALGTAKKDGKRLFIEIGREL
jgi:hypothetical protein